VYGSVQVKAKKSWEEGSRGIEKNASLRSRTEKWEAEAGICDKRVYGFGTKGWIGTMAMLMRRRSWTRWKDPLVFLTANMGVLNGE